MEEKLVTQFLVALGFAPYAAIAGAAVALLDYLTWYFNKTSENTKDTWLGLKYEGQALQGLVVWTLALLRYVFGISTQGGLWSAEYYY